MSTEMQLATEVYELAARVRTEIGHEGTGASDALLTVEDDELGYYEAGVRILAVPVSGYDQVLWAGHKSLRGALTELVEALRDMLRHGRAPVGGRVETPVFYTSVPPVPALGQIWHWAKGYGGRTVRVDGLGLDSRNRPVIHMVSDHHRQRRSTVSLSTLMSPGSGWKFVKEGQA